MLEGPDAPGWTLHGAERRQGECGQGEVLLTRGQPPATLAWLPSPHPPLFAGAFLPRGAPWGSCS